MAKEKQSKKTEPKVDAKEYSKGIKIIKSK